MTFPQCITNKFSIFDVITDPQFDSQTVLSYT